MRAEDTITLRNPMALRALAHPARQRLISELFGGRVLTATEAAELVGLTPSAVSHHLRALEKWGLARRAPQNTDGRQRPWEGTARKLVIEPTDASDSLAALESLMATQLADFTGQLHDFLENRQSDPWQSSYQGWSRSELHLTREETMDLRDRINAIVTEYADSRDPHQHCADARRTAVTWSVIPREPPPS